MTLLLYILLDRVFVYFIKPSSAKTFAPCFSVKICIANERNTCNSLNNAADYWENNYCTLFAKLL